MMLIAQISDTHIKAPGQLAYRRVDTAPYLSAAVDHLRRLRPRPDLVLITGDLTDRGRPAEYAHLKSILAPLDLPVHVLPGNHDDRDAMREAWPEAPWAAQPGRLHHVIDQGPVRIICLDSLVPGSGGGHLGPDDLEWLDRTLSDAPDQPTIVALHHPPFAIGIRHMDIIGLDGAADFATVMTRHRQVERILCGHLHRPNQTLVGGRLAMSCPSTAHQVALDLDASAPASFVFEPPGYLLHLWRPSLGMVTHAAMIGDYGEHYPFFENGALID